MNRKEAKALVADLWKSGHKAEAKALVRLARGVSEDDKDLQYKVFNDLLNDMGVSDPRLNIDSKKSLASFYVNGLSIVEFPRFLERFMRHLFENGTRKYKLDHIDRKDPMRVYIKF